MVEVFLFVFQILEEKIAKYSQQMVFHKVYVKCLKFIMNLVNMLKKKYPNDLPLYDTFG